ncbi:MAG: hypothetical protein AAF720_12805 [Pseudomonadota bacterium]
MDVRNRAASLAHDFEQFWRTARGPVTFAGASPEQRAQSDDANTN